MANLAIEQKLQENGQLNGAAATSAPNYVNLGGFAVSFEDLLQRVGARLEHAFTAANKSAGIPEPASRAEGNADNRDYADTRDAGSADDNRRDGDAGEHGRTTASDSRDNGAERGSDTPKNDNAADNAADRGDNADRDAQGARDKSENADNTGDDDADSGDNAGETAQSGKQDGNDGSEGTDGGEGKTAADSPVNQNAADAAHSATQAAAVYAAGLIGNKGQETAKSAQSEHQTQAQKGVDVTDNTALQAAAGKSAKAAANNHTSGQRNQQAQTKAPTGGEQKAQSADPKANTQVQNQQQQLARAIGADSRINVNVNVANEQSSFTSKPTFTVANASVLTADAGNGKPNAQNAQTGQQQGQNTGQTQQAQLAAQQQAQAAQQANVQGSQQGGQGGTGPGGAATTTGVQSAGGGAQHAGGNEAMNNSTQTASAGQQSQQAQQTREAQPHQHAQQAQRGNQAGNAVTEQVSVKITKALQAGTDRISIQLKPAELGRVDVKMEMTHDGRVMTVVTAEKQDTLDMLRRDSSELQKALADAGLQSGDMEFNLKGQEQQNADGQGDGSQIADGAEAGDGAETDINDGVMSAWESGIFANGRLDMRA